MQDDTPNSTAFVIIDNDSREPSWLQPSAEAAIRALHEWAYRMVGATAYMLTPTSAVIIAEHSTEQNEHDFTELKPASPWQPHQHKIGTKIHFKSGDDTDAGKITALVIGAYDDNNERRRRAWGNDERQWVVGYVVDDEFVAETDVIEVIGKAVSNE